MNIIRLAPLAAAWLLVACGDPGTFKPARNAHDHAWVEDRARSAESEEDMMNCEYMGTVEASGDDIRYDISHTAAIHGATHYYIKHVDDSIEGYQTNTYVSPGTAFGQTATSTTRAIHSTFAWAKVYYCGRN